MRLREIDERDLVRINAWRNDREVLDLLGNNFLYIAGTVDRDWYGHYLANRHQAVRLAILPDDGDDPVGMVNLTGIHRINRSAEFSILIGEKSHWGRGLGRLATEAMLRHGFADLNLHRIWLTVLADNERARRLYRSVGFIEEGLARDAVYKNGAYCDLVQMALLGKA